MKDADESNTFSSESKWINGYQTTRQQKFDGSLQLVPINQIGGKICIQPLLPVNLKSNLDFMNFS